MKALKTDKNNKSINQATSEFYKLGRLLSKSINKFLIEYPSYTDFLNSINSTVRQYEDVTKQFIDQVKNELEKGVPRKTGDFLVKLGNRGWFVPMILKVDSLLAVDEIIDRHNQEEIDSIMCSTIQANIKDIKNVINETSPRRKKLLESAFTAHDRQEYNLSVPVFLAQTDGICKEKLGVEFFRKRQNKPLTAEIIESYSLGPFTMALLQPFRTNLSISLSEYERNNKDISINRHQVLHGEVVDYGTKVNSFKCISLLGYIASVLCNINKKKRIKA